VLLWKVFGQLPAPVGSGMVLGTSYHGAFASVDQELAAMCLRWVGNKRGQLLRLPRQLCGLCPPGATRPGG